MKHLGFYIRPSLFHWVIALAFASGPVQADEYFQDAVFEELQNVGVDTDTFRSKLKEGDFSGAKSLLEDQKDKTPLSEVEEEVAQIIARKVIRKVRAGNSETRNPERAREVEVEYEEPTHVGEVIPPHEQGEKIERVVLDEEESKNENPPLAQVRNSVSRNHPIPGESVSPYVSQSLPTPPPSYEQPKVESGFDKGALMEAGIRELHPGMSIFRFLKVQVKIWSKNKKTAEPVSLFPPLRSPSVGLASK